MQAGKEIASNIAASAISGKDKTQATLQEKVEKMKAHDPIEKDMATQRKEEKINQAELNKLEAREQNATAKQAASAGGGTGTNTHFTARATGHPTGGHQMPAMPGHETGQPIGGQVIEGVVEAHPIGTNTTNTGFGTGGNYS